MLLLSTHAFSGYMFTLNYTYMFRNPPKRKIINSRSTNVDRKHNEMIKSITENKNSINDKKIKLENMMNSLKALEPTSLEARAQISFDMDKLRNEINDVENSSIENYIIDVGATIASYHEIVETPTTGDTADVDVLAFFHKTCDTAQIAQNETKTKRSTLAKQFFQMVDPDNNPVSSKVDCMKCPICDTELSTIMTEGIVTCEECGYFDDIVIDSQKSSFKDPPQSVSYYAYQPRNHFIEILQQFQGKENVTIPDEVIDKLKIEIRKHRISNLAKLDNNIIRNFLKKIGKTSYYENIATIIYKLTGQHPCKLSPETEKQLIAMFDLVEPTWTIVRPSDRDNFLSYRYTLYKFMELLDLKKYMKGYNIPNREHIIDQDKVWKRMCEEVVKLHPELVGKWRFIPTT